MVNGLLEREDWNAAIKMPLGTVPAGLLFLFLAWCIILVCHELFIDHRFSYGWCALGTDCKISLSMNY